MSDVRLPATQETLFRSALPIAALTRDPAIAFEEVRSALLEWADHFSLQELGMPLEGASGTETSVSFSIETPRGGLRIVDSELAGDLSPFGVGYWYRPGSFTRRGEVTLGVDAGHAVFHERVIGVYGESFGEPVVTRFVSARYDIRDGGARLSGAASTIVDEAGVDALWNLLTSEHRRLPVVVVSEPFLFDANVLAERLHGVAHVVAIANRMTFVLRDIAGRDNAVFGGAVRFYGDLGPGSTSYVLLGATLSAAAQAGRAEQLVLSRAYSYARGMASRFGSLSLEDVEQQLLATAASHVATVLVTPSPATTAAVTAPATPEPAPVPEVPAEVRLEPPAAISEPSAEVVDLRARVERLEAALDTRETEYLHALDELERIREPSSPSNLDLGTRSGPVHPAVRNLMAAIQLLTEATHEIQIDFESIRAEADVSAREVLRLQRRLERMERVVTIAPAARPVTLDPDEIDEWVERRFEGRLELHARALASLGSAQYDEPEEVVRALEILGDEYHAMRTRPPEDDEPRLRWEAALAGAGLRFSGAISDTEFGRHRRLYTVPYGGIDRRLDYHLRNGGATADPRRALRIYFFWDAERRRVIVGSLPAHLPNSMS